MKKEDSYELNHIFFTEMRQDIKEIKEQVYKTNGRVSKLEFWRNAIAWAGGIFLSIAVPIGVVLITKLIK